ncbi:hypothetical protein LSAT2_021486 [Lamellibrachia satsuma]|nr:hypothetical protein LSAT2_021486 [Lamellibrachia satsuma]
MPNDDPDNCVVCNKLVRPRQQALQCDDCDRWQHRVCQTGLTQRRYRQLVADDSNSDIWQCSVCCGRQVADKEPAGDVINNGADVHIVYADVHANPGLVLPDLDGSPYTINPR